jgi:hypothetical protein
MKGVFVMNHRYLLCLLICCALLYMALPRLNMHAAGLEGAFALSWLAFALLVFAGNLAALLFPKNRRQKNMPNRKQKQWEKTRMRAND